jgi:GNAT superfamily N-acetyltransferase
MMNHLKDYHAVEHLKNGMSITVRAIRPEDKDKINEAFRNLEQESIYTRFFAHKRALSEEDLKVITEVDFENVVALVVSRTEGPVETIIAAGRYVTYDTAEKPCHAEVAFTVEEDFHGLGIASRILKHLTGIARNKGVAAFEAEVLSENKAMLNVFSRSGLPMKQSREDGVVHVTLQL